jgi:hypothetical protein
MPERFFSKSGLFQNTRLFIKYIGTAGFDLPRQNRIGSQKNKLIMKDYLQEIAAILGIIKLLKELFMTNKKKK